MSVSSAVADVVGAEVEVEVTMPMRQHRHHRPGLGDLLNLTVDTADLQAVSAQPAGTSTAAATDSGSVSPAVWRGSTQQSAVQQVASGDGGDLLVGISHDAGSGGDFGASPLVSVGSWSQGGSNGAFAYSYTMAAPQVPAGPTPNVTLSYNSQSSDGRTSATNNQVSWIGEGWDYLPRIGGSGSAGGCLRQGPAGWESAGLLTTYSQGAAWWRAGVRRSCWSVEWH
ncbi:hypothetical protein [Streptomyces sp. NPDC018693]|uniref:hypothetical protein n=1 Tax=unclassified Streptomyces TaxID=2593676 RepID=UPI0037B5DA27